ncbi:MAG: DUF3429 domain-containing protein [Pseudomonadota bacterium]
MNSTARAIPRTALLLGWAGVLPFAATALASIVGPEPLASFAGKALLGYGAVILGFMSGVQWGIAMFVGYQGAGARSGDAGSDERRVAAPVDRGRLAISVVPALVGFGALLIPSGTFALGVLIAGFAGLLAYDLATVRAGRAPAWYGSLRVQLTSAVIAILGVAMVTAVIAA